MGQWDKGELSKLQLLDQVSRGEWHLTRDGSAICAALRFLWADPLTWGKLDGFAGYVHGSWSIGTTLAKGSGEDFSPGLRNRLGRPELPCSGSIASRLIPASVATTSSKASGRLTGRTSAVGGGR